MSLFNYRPTSRVEWFIRSLTIYFLIVTSAVMGGVIFASLFDVQFSRLLTSSWDERLSCNIGLGARVLFCVLWLGDIATVIAAIRLSRDREDVEKFQQMAAKTIYRNGEPYDGRQPLRVKISLLVFAVIAYSGSYYLAYGNQGLCAHKWLFQTLLDGWYIVGVSLGRGLCLLIGYTLYFGLIGSSNGSGRHG